MTDIFSNLSEIRGGSRILLVDDDVATLDALRRTVALRFPALRIDVASSVTKAVARLRVPPYAAIVTDLRMPVGSGLELLQHARRCSPDVAVPIVSGHLDEAIASIVRDQGACAVLSKPLDREVLTRAITEALRSRANEIPILG